MKKINIELYDKNSIKKFIDDSKINFPEIKFKLYKNFLFFSSKKNKIKFNLKQNIINALKIIERTQNKKAIYEIENKIKFTNDPLKKLIKNNEVVKIDDNLFQFQGEFLKIFRNLDLYFKNLAIKKFKATEQENPILWPIDLYKKINYFDEFPQQILMISGLKKNNDNYNNFSRKYNSKKDYSKIDINNDFEKSDYGLQPAVCDNCYYALRNLKNFKNHSYTTYNKVFRNEKSENKSLDRLISFTVRDIMFVGNRTHISNMKSKILKEIIKFLNIAEINCSIETADDPFFIGKFNKKLYQQSFELKYEILAEIPFLKKKIAIGSINDHLDTFGKAFNIRNNSKFINSSCFGIGYERLLLAIYSQHGNNTLKWPKNLRKILFNEKK